MRDDLVKLVESNNDELAEQAVSEAIDKFFEHKDIDLMLEELNKLEEGPIQGVFNVLNRHVIPNTAKFVEFIKKIFLAKGMSEEEVDELLKDVEAKLKAHKDRTGRTLGQSMGL